MSTLTKELLAKWREDAERATPGPWRYNPAGRHPGYPNEDVHYLYAKEQDSEGFSMAMRKPSEQQQRDMSHIANMNPANTLLLLDRIAELEAQINTSKVALNLERGRNAKLVEALEIYSTKSARLIVREEEEPRVVVFLKKDLPGVSFYAGENWDVGYEARQALAEVRGCTKKEDP